jgi:hypothetical protein
MLTVTNAATGNSPPNASHTHRLSILAIFGNPGDFGNLFSHRTARAIARKVI